jgi:hypothetical protein
LEEQKIPRKTKIPQNPPDDSTTVDAVTTTADSNSTTTTTPTTAGTTPTVAAGSSGAVGSSNFLGAMDLPPLPGAPNLPKVAKKRASNSGGFEENEEKQGQTEKNKKAISRERLAQLGVPLDGRDAPNELW